MPTGHDQGLVQCARGGDPLAWGALYEHYYPDVVRCLRAMLRDGDDAHDLAQETFERARAGLDSFGERAAFRAWLVGIAYNVARSHRRARDRNDRVLERYAGSRAPSRGRTDPEAQHTRSQVVKAVSSALDRLPGYLQNAFRLRYLEGLSLEGAAAVEGVTATNMGVRAHRAKHRMRQELERAGWSVHAVAGL